MVLTYCASCLYPHSTPVASADKAHVNKFAVVAVLVVASALQEAEESLRNELHKRTSTMLNMQVELEGKGAALQEAAVQQQVLQGRLQVGVLGWFVVWLSIVL